jgi:hypothetical protein
METLPVGMTDFKIKNYNCVLRNSLNMMKFMELRFNWQNTFHTAM